MKQVFGARLEVQGRLSSSQKSSIAESSKMKSGRDGGKLKVESSIQHMRKMREEQMWNYEKECMEEY